MKTHLFNLLILAILTGILTISCSNSHNPVDNSMPGNQNIADADIPVCEIQQDLPREIVAVYNAVIDPIAGTFEIWEDNRQAEGHMPLSNYYPNVLSITGYGFTPTFWADIRLSHPFPGSGLRAYDPRVIAMLPANPGVSMEYPILSITGNNSVVIDPDGYTKLFDNTGLPGNVNPFIAYFKSLPYRVWSSTGQTSETKRWKMDVSGFGGPFSYKLVVDVSTNFPNSPQPIIDNAAEPVSMTAEIGGDLTQLPSSTPVTVTLIDWQGSGGIGGVKIECQDIFSGLVSLDYDGQGPNLDEYVYTGTISNTNGASPGWYNLLIYTWDSLTGTGLYKEFPVYLDYEINFNIIDNTPPNLNFKPEGIFCSGNYAYVAAGRNGLHIFNISTPSNPTWVGSYDTPGFANEVVVALNYAYVADGDAGVQVIYVADPFAPIYIKTVDTPGTAKGIARFDWMVLVADGTGGVHILDIFTPASTYILKTIPTTNAIDIAVDMQPIACVADSTNGMVVIDFTLPYDAYVSDTIAGSCRGVAVNKWWVYYTDGYLVYVGDISDPSAIEIITSIGMYPDTPWKMDVEGDYLYVTHGYSDFSILDISSPLSLTLINQINVGGEPRNLFVNGATAYITNTDLGIQAVDVIPPESAYVIKTVETPSWPVYLTESNGYLYVSDEGLLGMRILDISPVTSTRIVTSMRSTPGFAREIEIQEPYAYIANHYTGFALADIDPPESAFVPHTVSFTDESNGIQIVGDQAFITDRSGGIKVLDISDPETADIAHEFDTDGYANDIHVQGDYAYILDTSYGLYIYDINPLETPTLVKSVPVPGSSPASLEYMDGYILIANRDYGIEIIDVEPYETASIVKTVDTPGSALRMHIEDGYAYVADYTSGVQILDVFPPSSAHVVTSIPSLIGSFDTCVSSNILYVADIGLGVRIFELW